MALRTAALLLTFLAALATGLGGGARAGAMPGGAAAGFEVVICGAEGAQTIRVDAAGVPIPEGQQAPCPCPCPCLDCLAAAEIAALPVPAHLPHRTARRSRAGIGMHLPALPRTRRARPDARGPPNTQPNENTA